MKRNLRIIHLIVVFLVLEIHAAYSQSERGVLNIRNYTPQEYGAHAQNLCITQDKRGIMYFGNNRGVLQYDGNYWEIIKVSNETSVTALDVDSNGRVYVGALDEIGYLVPNDTGKLIYRSLLPKLPKEIEYIDRVNRVICNKEGVYFISRSYIILWNGKDVKYWATESQFHTSFLVDEKLYVSVKDSGIVFLENEQFKFIEASRALIAYNIFDISLFRGNFVITTNRGLFIYNGTSLRKVTDEIPTVYNGINVDNTFYAIGLFGDGLMVLNKDFKIEYLINLRNGLAEGTVHNVFVDRENNLWLALGRGIAKIELITPITMHKFDTGLKGTVEDVIRYKGKIYSSTSNGVFYFSGENNDLGRFYKMDNLDIDCYGLSIFELPNDTMLIACGVDGVYEIEAGKKPIRIYKGAPWSAFQSKTYANRLIIAEDVGLSSVVRIDGVWKEEGLVDGITESVFRFVEEKNGNLWLGTLGSGVIKTTTKIFSDPSEEILRYDTIHGLPKGPIYLTALNGGGILFATDDGIYKFNAKKNIFEIENKYKLPEHDSKTGVHRLSMDHRGQLWMAAFYEDNSYDIMYFRKDGWYKTPFLRYNSAIVQCFYHESNGVTWMGSADGLIRYDQNFRKDYDSPYSVSIRKVLANNHPVFEGAFFDKDSLLLEQQPDFHECILNFSQNDVTIEFSALSFFEEAGTKFSFQLEGQNDNWTDWSPSSKAVFTNIHEGEYVFRVKAKNIYGVESKESIFRFTVLPPWYRTVWAYVAYAILFIAFVWGAISVSTRSLKRIIQERTAEIVHQKEEIEKQKEIVDEKNKDILDSIKYAKRIQDAILPGEDHMKEVMGRDLFVLFKPKDIVSGDFYWMRVKGEKVLFSAVDCTGHGVPGAFVSIVGNNGLNRAVNEFGLIQPAAILDNLAKTVEDAFQATSNSDVRDGMDISLCSLEMTSYSTAILNWAGANNPLWIIKADNRSEIFEIKADKQPIGKFENRRPYINHELQLVKGDTVYIFTDGYADQFGGPAGKKFKYAQLKELLINMYDKNMTEQRELLNDYFETWKNTLEQIDDVCIIGVRI